MDYIDLYLIHWPVTPPAKPFAPTNQPMHVTWASNYNTH
jgi:diketogulonate reductase-like aldo/keto reductase